MIQLITTVHSVAQAKELLQLGVDILYVGEERYSLRLPTSFSYVEMEEIVQLAHNDGKRVVVSVNAIMHNEQIDLIVSHLQRLEKMKVDAITVGDPGVVQLLNKHRIQLPFIYDAQTLVTNARQINFWAKRGAIGAVLARELVAGEIKSIAKKSLIPIEVQVYGPTCIHHSKRNLLQNYFRYTEQERSAEQEDSLFISEVKKEYTEYPIYEDNHGTHIFATYDINLIHHLPFLYDAKVFHWKLDGLFTEEKSFVEIVQAFLQAKEKIEKNQMTKDLLNVLHEQVIQYHPKDRALDPGFFIKDEDEII